MILNSLSFAGPSTERQEEEYAFEILTTEQIVEHMVESIKDVNNVIQVTEKSFFFLVRLSPKSWVCPPSFFRLQIPATTVRILLNHFKWDKEKLMEKFYSDDQEKVFEAACIVSPFKKRSPSSLGLGGGEGELGGGGGGGGVGGKSKATADCDICFLTQHSSMMTGLECGHQYCTNCWMEYLTTKIMDEGESQSIECPGSGCKILVDDQTVMKLVKEAKVKLKYQHLITNSFVECNRLMRWCSAPDCNFAARVRTVEPKPIKCKCGHIFCFVCSENWHDPVRSVEKAVPRHMTSEAMFFFSFFFFFFEKMPPDQKVDQEVRRRQRDFELDIGQYQGVPKVPGHHREGWRLQSYDLQESGTSLSEVEVEGGTGGSHPRVFFFLAGLQSRLLLGVPGAVGASREQLVQLQQI